MQDYYTTKEASEITGASRPILRTYTERYARWLSTDATPEPGGYRKFTAADLKLLAFVYQQTQAGATHERVQERLAAGELERFEWQPPEPQVSSAEPGAQAAEQAGTALVPIERLQAAQVLLLDAQKRESQAAEQVAALQTEVQRLAAELGQAKGELQGFKAAQYRSPKWWRAIFGGRSE